MRTSLGLILAISILAIAACEGANEASVSEGADISKQVPAAPHWAEASGIAYTAATTPEESVSRSETKPNSGSIALPLATDARRIIYHADLDLAVDQFDNVPAEVGSLASKHGGFIASSAVQGSDGEPREGRWTLRIPSARYDTFIAGTESLGQVRQMTSNSQEVTAEYTDLEARVRNSRAEETRLHKHLNENTRSLDEILKVEREIARVRGEIERYEGRLNVLEDLTALSTVTLRITEIKNYAAAPTEEPGFKTQVARAWNGSLDSVGSCLKGVGLFAVSATPWMVVLLPVGLIAFVIARRAQRVWMKPAGA